MLSMHGECAWRVCMVSVHGECAWRVCMLSVHAEGVRRTFNSCSDHCMSKKRRLDVRSFDLGVLCDGFALMLGSAAFAFPWPQHALLR
jgi:hypothetical protein